MTYDRVSKGFGPTIISHEENPKKKFLEDAIKKYENRSKKPDSGYRVIVTETKVDHK